MTLARYLSRVLGGRILAAGTVLLALGLSLDLIKSADELIRVGGAGALAHYAALRAPAMAATILPLAVMVGGITGFLSLGRRSELTVMRAAGQPVMGLLLRLAPLAVVLGIGHHLLVDRASAWSERALADAFAGIAETPVPEPGARVMGRIGEAVVMGRLARHDGQALAPVAVYALDPEGRITGRTDAAYARFQDGRWVLAEERRIGDVPGSAGVWESRLTPADVRALASGEAAATGGEAAAALSGLAVATRSRAYYATRLAQSRAAFAVPAIMLVCAAFASFTAPRGPGGLGLAALGAVIGLGFVTIEGLFASFGQVGLMNAALAAWAPVVLFASAAVWLLLMREE